MSRVWTATAIAALAAGCTSPTPDLADPANRAGASQTIVWVSSPTLRSASDDLRQVLVDAFEQAYPSIKVVLRPGADSTNRLHDELKSELSAGSTTPDVYSGDVIWPAEFGHEGLALPLDEHLPDSFWKQFVPPDSSPSDSALISAMSYRHHIYAVPYFIDEGFLFYRKDLLAGAGLEPPTTWEQLVQDSLKLKSLGQPYQFVWQGASYEGLACVWTELLADAIGSGPTDTGQPTEAEMAARLTSPQALKALRFLQGLITEGISPAELTSDEEPRTDELFDSGQAAFLRSWDSSYANAKGSASKIPHGDNVGVIAPPNFEGREGRGFSVIGGWNLFINPHSRNLDADLTFVRWMAGEQAQRIVGTQFSEIPANYSVRHSLSADTDNPVFAATKSTRTISRPSSTPVYTCLSKIVFSAVHDALPTRAGAVGYDPQKELADAAQELGSGKTCHQTGGVDR